MRRQLVPLVALVVAVLAPTGHAGATDAAHGIGVMHQTFVDKSRPTAANGDCAKIASRSLPTTILYPAQGGPSTAPVPGARPATADGPYPLIVFAHGFSADPQFYEPLLARWASAGFVVAAPTFPLSSSESPCGAIAGDVLNQPQDMSFVIDSMLRLSNAKGSALHGLVDQKRIGAAGHSNGAITMYGLVANTALRDNRVTAVAVLSGTLQPYSKGRYDLAEMPPILIAHGTDDALIPYDASVGAFNRARGPKGLLTISGGDHGSSADPALVGAATVDFFDAYLRGDAAARNRLQGDETAGTSVMKFVAKKGATDMIPTTTTVARHLEATVTPHTNLTGGQMVDVTWSGYTPGKAVSILECNPSDRNLTNSGGCDYSKAALLHPNPTGEGSLQLEIVQGQVGDGVCDATHPGCFILVNNESSTDPKNSVFIDITFAK